MKFCPAQPLPESTPRFHQSNVARVFGMAQGQAATGVAESRAPDAMGRLATASRPFRDPALQLASQSVVTLTSLEWEFGHQYRPESWPDRPKYRQLTEPPVDLQMLTFWLFGRWPGRRRYWRTGLRARTQVAPCKRVGLATSHAGVDGGASHT